MKRRVQRFLSRVPGALNNDPLPPHERVCIGLSLTGRGA
jgi:hypothetical protein